MAEKIELTVSEIIDRAKDGRSQSWIVNQMNKVGLKINEVQFSRKKKGLHNGKGFTKKELEFLTVLLNTKF
ncbi:MAG: hypothetical protein ABIP51_22590 [Bacteroidia bacterium]